MANKEGAQLMTRGASFRKLLWSKIKKYTVDS